MIDTIKTRYGTWSLFFYIPIAMLYTTPSDSPHSQVHDVFDNVFATHGSAL